MENNNGDLLMISEPNSQWDYVLLATNDTKKIEQTSTLRGPEIVDDSSANKTLWWLTRSRNGQTEDLCLFTNILPMDHRRVHKKLSDKSKLILTHRI